MEKIINFLKDETGTTAAEYSIMAALIAVVIVTIVIVIGKQVMELFNLCLEGMNNQNI